MSAEERPMRRATTGYITYVLKIICLGMIVNFPVDNQIGFSAVWVWCEWWNRRDGCPTGCKLSNNQQMTFYNWIKGLGPARRIAWWICPRPTASQYWLSSLLFWKVLCFLGAVRLTSCRFWRTFKPRTTCLTGWIRGKWFLTTTSDSWMHICLIARILHG